jgi:hypothetical protein
MKRILIILALMAAVGISLVPIGIAGGDQAFKTTRSTFYSLVPSAYPLRDGFVVSTHMNGPVNFEKKEFQLHGAKPNTQFFIFRVFSENLILTLPGGATKVVPAGFPVYAGDSLTTNDQGNGNINTKLAPDAPNLVALKPSGTTSLHLYNLLSDGFVLGGPDGKTVLPKVAAYRTEVYQTVFDWKWTP